MEIAVDRTNEDFAAQAFTAQSGIFDDIYSGNAIVDYKRERVRTHVLQYLKPGANILELNSGTGDDALFFSKQGFQVHATDVSVGMQQQLKQKVKDRGMEHMISNELCSFTQLHLLKNRGPFDHIFSNFAGLNCTSELDWVLLSLPRLLKPGGTVTLVILPKFCLWESLLLFKGKFKTGTRRWFSKSGVNAHVEGTHFTCWYYNPSYIVDAVEDDFEVLAIEGLCALVPPSYIEGFAERHRRIYKFLKKAEDKLKSSWPWKFIGDYYIISLQKK